MRRERSGYNQKQPGQLKSHRLIGHPVEDATRQSRSTTNKALVRDEQRGLEVGVGEVEPPLTRWAVGEQSPIISLCEPDYVDRGLSTISAYAIPEN